MLLLYFLAQGTDPSPPVPNYALWLTVANLAVLAFSTWNTYRAGLAKTQSAASAVLAEREASTYKRLEHQVEILAERLDRAEQDRAEQEEYSEQLEREVERREKERQRLTARVRTLEAQVAELSKELAEIKAGHPS